MPASTGAAADAGAAAEAGSEAQGSGSEAHGQRPRSAQLDARSSGRRERAQALYVRRAPSRSHTSAHYMVLVAPEVMQPRASASAAVTDSLWLCAIVNAQQVHPARCIVPRLPNGRR